MTTKRTFPNSRMAGIKMAGGIREIMGLSEKMAQNGRDIIHMDLGKTDFNSPQKSIETAVYAVTHGNVHYTDMAGTFELRSAVAEKYNKDYNLGLTADENIVISQGATEALSLSMLTLMAPGEEMIIPAPYFTPYIDEAQLFGIKPVIAQSKEENGFKIKASELEEKITSKTAVILLNSPNNPSGAVYSREDLQEIADIAIKHDLWIISDECYEKFVYEGKYVSIISLPGMAERTVIVSSASKTWSMTGWRVGWVVAPKSLRPYVNKCHQNIATCANSFAQAGVCEAFKSGNVESAAMVKEYKRRRDMVYRWISETKGMTMRSPEGAFYAFPSIKAFGMPGIDFCMQLLEETGVSTTPGEAFGMPGYIRLAYCQDYDYIEKGMKRIKDFCAKLDIK